MNTIFAKPHFSQIHGDCQLLFADRTAERSVLMARQIKGYALYRRTAILPGKDQEFESADQSALQAKLAEWLADSETILYCGVKPE
jgi:hypothetical protein